MSRDVLSRLTYEDRRPTVLRSLALTLKFYSKKAYDYVREKFNLALPHPTTIRSWYNHIDGDPGFIRDASVAMKLKAKEAKKEVNVPEC